jgi:subtilase family serine protease
MAPGLNQVLVYVGKYDADILNKMATDNIAEQLSCSWHWSPSDPSTDTPIFREFASQGQSLFVAAGDTGAYSSSSITCPADDAWVTSVGGTDLSINADGSWSSESAWPHGGGGVSPNKIPIPRYQQAAGVITSANGGSLSYRNVPDVAAEANHDNFACANGTCGVGSGTSFASPRWAGFMALVNQLAIASGRSTVGFLNPTIYTIGLGANYESDLHDITSGSNGGYSAVSGYDLVTGWGSPNGQDLIDELVGLSGNLVETSVTNPPSTLLDGGTFSVTDTVKNIGSSEAGPSVTRYYLATTTSKTTGHLLGGERNVPLLVAGAASSGTVTVTAQAGTPTGDYFLLACPNDLSGAGFGNEKNCKASASEVTISGPDLTETSVTNPPGAMLVGSSFSINDTVKNIGDATAGASITRYYVSRTTSKTSSSVLLTGSRSVPSLAVNAVSSGTVTVVIPLTTKPGTYYLLACADDTELVPESNEENNCKAASGTVVLTDVGGGAIQLGQTVAGRLIPSAPAGHCRSGIPADRWEFTLAATTTITVEADSTAFDTYLCLLNSTNGAITTDDNSGPGTDARIVYQNLPVGTYYIEVSSSSGAGGGAYTLTLE